MPDFSLEKDYLLSDMHIPPSMGSAIIYKLDTKTKKACGRDANPDIGSLLMNCSLVTLQKCITDA